MADFLQPHTLEFHNDCCKYLCRVCCNVAQTKQQKKEKILYSCKSNSAGILVVFGIKTSGDDSTDKLCNKCYNKMRFVQKHPGAPRNEEVKKTYSEINILSEHSFSETESVLHCKICSKVTNRMKGGRPKKEKFDYSRFLGNTSQWNDTSEVAVQETQAHDACGTEIDDQNKCNNAVNYSQEKNTVKDVHDVLSDYCKKPLDEPLDKVEEEFIKHAMKRKKFHAEQQGIIKIKTKGQISLIQAEMKQEPEDGSVPTGLEVNTITDDVPSLLNGKSYKCDHCDKTFSRPSARLSHQRTHPVEKPYKCSQCDKTFAYAAYLKTHERVHAVKSFQCDWCDKTFSRSYTLAQHMNIHTGERPFKCDICDKSFAQGSTLAIHKRTHTGEKPYMCDLCDKAFVTRSKLVDHKRTHTGERPYQCPQCDRAFTRISRLYDHQKTHTDEKPFQCDQCDKAFFQRISLVTHKRTHTGEKPFPCDLCDKAFHSFSNLAAHKKIHKGGKPFQCQQCDKAFARVSHLSQHRKIHTGEKPFQCDQCNKAFIQRVSLVTHKRTHTGEKPFQCDQCAKRFISSSNLTMHKKTHMGEKPFYKPCDNTDSGSSTSESDNISRDDEKTLPYSETIGQSPTSSLSAVEKTLPYIKAFVQSPTSTLGADEKTLPYTEAFVQSPTLTPGADEKTLPYAETFVQSPTSTSQIVSPIKQEPHHSTDGHYVQTKEWIVVNGQCVPMKIEPEMMTAAVHESPSNTEVQRTTEKTPEPVMTIDSQALPGDAVNQRVKEEPQTDQMTTVADVCSENSQSAAFKQSMDETSPQPDMTIVSAVYSQTNVTNMTAVQNSHSDPVNQHMKKEPIPGMTCMDRTAVAVVDPHIVTVKVESRQDMTTVTAVGPHSVTVKEEPHPNVPHKQSNSESSDETGIGTNLFYSVISGQGR